MTNNRADFIRLLGKVELHPGLIVLVPNVLPAVQRTLFKAALEHSAGRDLMNTALETIWTCKLYGSVSISCPAREARPGTHHAC